MLVAMSNSLADADAVRVAPALEEARDLYLYAANRVIPLLAGETVAVAEGAQ